MIIDMGSLLQMAGVSFGITAGSRFAEWVWKKNRDTFIAGVNSFGEKVEDRTGYKAPIEVHLVYDGIVKKIVAAVDYVANPVVFRRVERALLALVAPATRSKLLEEYFGIVKGKIAEAASAELKQIINEEKERVAVDAVGSQASISLPPEFLATRDIKADVRAAVVASKQVSPELSSGEINAKIDATREKLDALMKK